MASRHGIEKLVARLFIKKARFLSFHPTTARLVSFKSYEDSFISNTRFVTKYCENSRIQKLMLL